MARQVPVLPLQQSISKRQKSSDLINCQWTNSKSLAHFSHTQWLSHTHTHNILPVVNHVCRCAFRHSIRYKTGVNIIGVWQY